MILRHNFVKHCVTLAIVWWIQSMSDRWVGADWPVDRWRRYQSLTSSSVSVYSGHSGHKFWQFLQTY